MKEKNILLLAVFVHLVAAWFSTGFHHPDEHYQLIEFANYKLGNISASQLPWEFSAQMRPAFQPFIVFYLCKICYAFGLSNPFSISFLLRLISSLLALFTAWHLHQSLKKYFTNSSLATLHLYLSLFAWGLVYTHIRFSSENWSALFFTLAISFYLREHKRKYLLFGLFAGLSFICRYQSLFFIAGAGLWMLIIDKITIKNIALIFSSFVAVFLFGLICDHWLYGSFNLTVWNYFKENILLNKSAAFGVEPWYWYFTKTYERLIPPFSLVLLIGFLTLPFTKPKSIITWSVVFFAIGHLCVAHKEYRFLFPLAFFVPFMVINFIEKWNAFFNTYQTNNTYRRSIKIFGLLFCITNIVCLPAVCFRPANGGTKMLEFLYDHVKVESVLIYEKQNPYMSGENEAVFYKNKLIQCMRMDEAMKDSTLLAKKNILIFDESFPAFSKVHFYDSLVGGKNKTLLYQSLPTWLRFFNVNHWIEREGVYVIYKIDDSDKRFQ